MQDSVIKVEHVNKTFGRLEAVKDLSFSVHGATCFGLLGPNGAGKTTMMRMLYGRTLRDGIGESVIDVFGYDPQKDELDIKYLSGVVPQENNLDDELNVKENLMVYARFYSISRKEALSRIDYLLDFLELSEKSTSLIRELSGGMKRRLVIARALLNNPRLLILDEPTTGLDPQVRHLIWDKIRQLKRSGITILVTTHYMEEAFEICDSILIMHKGSKLMEGNPHLLLEQNIEKFVLEVLHRDAAEALAGKMNTSLVRKDGSHEVPLFYSQSLEELKKMADSLTPVQYHLRQANLEDLFLRATGRALNEVQ
jgi:lipooligosaccharide transport system ATP-binding protein